MLEIQTTGPQPLVIEGQNITWRFMLPYAEKRKLRAAAIREMVVDEDENVRLVPDLERLERMLLTNPAVSVTWEGVTLNGTPIPYDSSLIENGEVPDGEIMSLLLAVVGRLFSVIGATVTGDTDLSSGSAESPSASPSTTA